MRLGRVSLSSWGFDVLRVPIKTLVSRTGARKRGMGAFLFYFQVVGNVVLGFGIYHTTLA
jgi:hypothetical protein